ncbi:MAG TPA: hypothetical protein VER55_10905 [Ardenticatenaceae bacterium]|nr:hypothetical protein [Ardenticatenaceae bacterium]
MSEPEGNELWSRAEQAFERLHERWERFQSGSAAQEEMVEIIVAALCEAWEARAQRLPTMQPALWPGTRWQASDGAPEAAEGDAPTG